LDPLKKKKDEKIADELSTVHTFKGISGLVDAYMVRIY
jgi:hypothetical protein